MSNDLYALRCAGCWKPRDTVTTKGLVRAHVDRGVRCSGTGREPTTLIAERRRVLDDLDFSRAVCARVLCRVVIWAGRGHLADDATGRPVPVCKVCPEGVNFTTSYPPGTTVRLVGGFAAGFEGPVERVVDHYPSGPGEYQPHYAGRSYVLDLPGYGERPMPENFVVAVDPADVALYTTRR